MVDWALGEEREVLLALSKPIGLWKYRGAPKVEWRRPVVFGDRDPLYPVSLAVELKDAIPRSWLWVVPNGGHGPVFGPHAPAFVKTALAFLAGRYSEMV